MSELTRRDFIKMGAASAAALATGSLETLADGSPVPGGGQKPNVLFVFADQWRRQSVGFMKADPVVTPNIDRFASSSVALGHAFSSCPVCSPFRASLMTGQYPQSHGVLSNCSRQNPGLGLAGEQECFGAALAAAGYATGYIGKWHLDDPSRSAGTSNDVFTPPGKRRLGFDFWYTYNTGSPHFKPHHYRDKPEKIYHKGWCPTHETDIAIDYIRRRDKTKPFALFMSWYPPHPPYICPDKYRKRYEGRKLRQRGNFENVDLRETRSAKKIKYFKINTPREAQSAYYGAVAALDDDFQRLLDCLAAQGIAENTIVVLTSDHGEMLGSHGKMGKVGYYEESVGIPFIVRWPGKIKAKRDKLLFGTVDMMPTVLGLAGAAIPKTVEGTDYSKLFLGAKQARPESIKLECPRINQRKYAQRDKKLKDGWRAVRTQRYTYVAPKSGKAQRILFDLQEDPYQMKPIGLGDGQDKAMKDCEAKLRAWLTKTKDPFELA